MSAMKYAIELQKHEIVAVGDLNPAIFHPAWFSAEGIINRREAEAANVDVISAQAAVFQVDWLMVQVFPDRFVVGTESEAYNRPLHDLVASTFSRLVHTPIRALGINYHCHCRFDDEKRWNNISEYLAPASSWSHLLDTPRMCRLAMQDVRLSGPKGHVEIIVEPSVRVRDGMYVYINNHYDLTNEALGCRAMLDVLQSEWSVTIQKYKDVVNGLVQND